MYCEECGVYCTRCGKYCYQESNDEPCEYLQTDNQYLEETLKSIKRSMY